MQLVTHISQVPLKGDTNYYRNDEMLNYWISKKVLYFIVIGDTFFLFRRDRDFYHLYYITKNISSLVWDLKHFISHYYSEIFVSDIIEQSHIPLFEIVGFKKYKSLERMRVVISGTFEVSEDVVFAKVGEAQVIFRMFENNFDKYAEQLPTIEELKIMIRNGEILVVRDKVIAGILIRSTRMSSILKHFLVDPTYRGQKIGSKLLNYYLNESDVITLWVLSDNEKAISVYKHFGFKFDKLKDQVMICDRK